MNGNLVKRMRDNRPLGVVLLLTALGVSTPWIAPETLLSDKSAVVQESTPGIASPADPATGQSKVGSARSTKLLLAVQALDHLIGMELLATLAGLALAGAAFSLQLRPELADKIREIESELQELNDAIPRLNKNPSANKKEIDEKTTRRQDIENYYLPLLLKGVPVVPFAARDLLLAFFAFTVGLCSLLIFDSIVERAPLETLFVEKTVLRQRLELFDVSTSAALLIGGIYCLSEGAANLWKLVKAQRISDEMGNSSRA